MDKEAPEAGGGGGGRGEELEDEVVGAKEGCAIGEWEGRRRSRRRRKREKDQ